MRDSNVLAPFLRHSSLLDGLGLTPEGCQTQSPLPFQETPCDPKFVAKLDAPIGLSSVKKRLFSDNKEPENKIFIDEQDASMLKAGLSEAKP